MSKTWLTWTALEMNVAERRALRKAGLVAADVVALEPLELVAASGEVVTEARAVRFCRRAGLLQIATPAWVTSLERAGVESRDDLATRRPQDLFDTWQEVSPYTGLDIYKYIASTITAAGGGRFEIPSGAELVRRAWERRFGAGRDPVATKLRLRVPSVKINAPVVLTEPDIDGRPKPPLHAREVAVTSIDDPRVFVGHWQWTGRFGAFLRLETLDHGATVEVVEGRTVASFGTIDIKRGRAPMSPDGASTGRITLLTPPHLRWRPWLADWGLPADCDLERTWVQVAVTADADVS